MKRTMSISAAPSSSACRASAAFAAGAIAPSGKPTVVHTFTGEAPSARRARAANAVLTHTEANPCSTASAQSRSTSPAVVAAFSAV